MKLFENIYEIYRYFSADYVCRVAGRLTEFKTNEKLGYRTSGSQAERNAGKMLADEMRSIGLWDVTMDEISVDSWTFEKAELRYTDAKGSEHNASLGGYQVSFDTNGEKEFTIVYAGQGTRADFINRDIKGKIVLVDINQRDDWWISYPAYEAHLHGAIAVLVAQSEGYSQCGGDALNAQDLCGPADAPVFSIARNDADRLIAAIQNDPDHEAIIWFDAKSTVETDGKAYNVWATIPGIERNGEQILFSAHYDAYFDGYQDNAVSVALMLSLARAFVLAGIQPKRTFVFCATAAEEWGLADAHYDWSAGAYAQITRIRPEWAGKTFANINFELPGYDLAYQKAQIRAPYELKSFLEEFIADNLPLFYENLTDHEDGNRSVFPKGVEILCPTYAWSDDFSFSISGIPATVTALREDFAKQKYHTQFDDESTFDEDVTRFHFNLYAALALAYDHEKTVPLDFSPIFTELEKTLDKRLLSLCGKEAERLLGETKRAAELARKVYPIIRRKEGINREILSVYKEMQDSFVRLTWHYVPIFPHEQAVLNIAMLKAASTALTEKDPTIALREYLWAVDNNWYAYHWSRETYDHFTRRVIGDTPERLAWGAGRVTSHVDLFDVVQSLQGKKDASASCWEISSSREINFDWEIERLDDAAAEQLQLLRSQTEEETMAVKRLIERISTLASEHGE